MSEIYIYLILFILAVAFLNSGLSFHKVSPITPAQNLSVVEHLTKFSNKPKNYRNTPEGFKSYGYSVRGTIQGEEATLEYQFPFIDSKNVSFSINLHAQNVSSIVDQFGAHHSCCAADQGGYQLMSADEQFLKKHFNKDGIYFRNPVDWGVDYNHLINISAELCTKIAHSIVFELQRKNLDNYINRVRAALNFVQYIPYGVPDFDAGEYTYFDFALPHESIAISYSDCDSKSTLFAAILKQMIAAQNIILVICKIDEGGHMITGVSDLPFAGQKIAYNGKEYLLLETTIPSSFEETSNHKYTDLQIIPVLST
jgi:hypothetical protein